MSVRLIIADATTIARLGYAGALASWPDVELVAEASNVDEARAKIVHQQPDVAIVDVDLPGLDLAAELRNEYPRLGLVVTGPANADLVIRSLEIGLSGYLPRSSPVEVLMSAVKHAAVAPNLFTSPALASALARRTHHAVLSPREQQVFKRLSSGASLTRIAQELKLTESTVRTYVARIHTKLHAHVLEEGNYPQSSG